MSAKVLCEKCNQPLPASGAEGRIPASCPICGTEQPASFSAAPLAGQCNLLSAELQNPYRSPTVPSERRVSDDAAAQSERRTQIKVGEIAAKTWEIYRRQPGICIGGFVICAIMSCVAQLFLDRISMRLESGAHEDSTLAAVYLALLLALLEFETWLSIGQTLLLLKVARREPAPLGLIFEGGPYVLRIVMTTALLAVAAIAIAMACMIPAVGTYVFTGSGGIGAASFFAIAAFPAIYVALIFFPACCLIIDRNLGLLTALADSWKLTRGNKPPMFGILLIGVVLNLAGLLTFCIGIVFTAPLAMLSLVVMYLTLSGESAKTADPISSH